MQKSFFVLNGARQATTMGCPYRLLALSYKMMFLRGKSVFQGVFPLDLIELQREFIGRVEAASGKPVILQGDPKFAGHATINIATKDQPAPFIRGFSRSARQMSFLMPSRS